MGGSGTPIGLWGASGEPLGSFGRLLAASGKLWDARWDALGGLWGALGRSWWRLGSSGALWGPLERSYVSRPWAALGISTSNGPSKAGKLQGQKAGLLALWTRAAAFWRRAARAQRQKAKKPQPEKPKSRKAKKPRGAAMPRAFWLFGFFVFWLRSQKAGASGATPRSQAAKPKSPTPSFLASN